MAFTTKCHCHRLGRRVAGALYIFNFENLDADVGCQASRRTIDTLTASRLRQAIQIRRKSCQLSERARERRRQIKAMLSNRPACCFLCVCGFVVRIEKTVFKRHRRRERKIKPSPPSVGSVQWPYGSPA